MNFIYICVGILYLLMYVLFQAYKIWDKERVSKGRYNLEKKNVLVNFLVKKQNKIKFR